MFKHGIQPQWEDAANAAGGQWNWRPNVDQQDKGAGLDALWCCSSSHFPHISRTFLSPFAHNFPVFSGRSLCLR